MKYHAVKTYLRSGGIAPYILNLGGKWPVLCPGRFTPGETASGTNWIAAWVGPRICGGEKKVTAPAYNRTPVVQPVA
jgi:hypothetical protein